jgi:hypothetical protein
MTMQRQNMKGDEEEGHQITASAKELRSPPAPN